MATEKDLELLDDYLSNRMKGQDKLDFEKRLEADASLQSELGLQKEFVEGIKRARVAELKAMLNEIAVPAPSNSSLMIKGALTAVVVAVVGTGLYFLINKGEAPVQTEVATKEPTVVQPAPVESTDAQKEEIVEQPKTETKSVEELDENKADAQPKSEKKSETKSSPLNQPSVEPYDPTKELEQASEKPDAVDETDAPSLTSSSIAVVTDNTDKKLNFHYQFKEGKLFLLGSFEKDLYEILEFFSNSKRTIFLYYNSNYYLLDESQSQPTPLNAITDQSLLQKLKASRGK